jgi:chaperonin GroEL (HSP60 family)
MKRVKTQTKLYTSDNHKLENMIIKTMDKISNIVGATLGPSGKNILIESEVIGIPNKNTKDGVSVFRALGASDPYEHLIIEQTRDAAVKTVNEAGDGPQPLWSKILTPNGFIEMRDIKEGMEICGTNGTVQKVVGVYPKGTKEIVKVKLSDEREVECCPDHLWEVVVNDKRRTVTTAQMMQDFVKTDDQGNNRFKYYIPSTKVDFGRNDELPLDPYLLGVLLGDGSLGDNGSIELSLGYAKKHILDKLKLPVGASLNVQKVESKNSYRVKIKGIRHIVDMLGLANTNSFSKFIPETYLFSSIENREKLLQGLIDTDGHVNSRDLFEFSTVSDQLVKDFLTLTRSLGKATYYKLHTRENDLDSYSDNSVHRVYELKGYKNGFKVVNIEKTGVFTEMQCIKVSNPDSLYITDDFVVTHNTTTATVLSAALTKNIFQFCKANPKTSPQKAVRIINKLLKEQLLPSIKANSIKITSKNRDLLEKVATISANGDKEMAESVMEAFEVTGFGSSSHVTIQELSGPSKYEVQLIEGFPVAMGYEESIGKFHPAFINDQGNQKCTLEKPLFILFDGKITDIVQVQDIFSKIGEEYVNGNSDFRNVVVVAHGFSDQVLTNLAYNFPNPNTINIVPLTTPINQIVNSQLGFLQDLSAFTGAKIFGMTEPLEQAVPADLGMNMENIEIYRFRTTITGDSDPTNIEIRVSELKAQSKQAESKIEKQILEERIGKLTSGIAQLKVYGSSMGELKEKVDRAEDAVCAVRAAITHGCLPGGCRMLYNLALDLVNSENPIHTEIVVPSLMQPLYKLLDNAGYSDEEVQHIMTKMAEDRNIVYDIENQEFGDAIKMGVLDATLAVEQALSNAVSISSVMGTLGGIIVSPRDNQLELQHHSDEENFQRTVDNAHNLRNEANERP